MILWAHTMRGAERPQFDDNHTPEAPATAPEYLETPADTLLKQKITDFKDTLERTRDVDVMSHSLTFKDEQLAGMYIPDGVHSLVRQYGQINGIIVDSSYLKGTETSLEILFEFSDDLEEESSYLSIRRPYNYTPRADGYDYVYDDRFDEESPINSIRPLSWKELNRCLASLIINNPDSTVSTFDAHDWYTESYENLTKILGNAASYSSSVHEYLLTDSEGGPAGSLNEERVSGKTVETRVYRIVEQNIDVNSEGTPSYYEKAIETSVDKRGEMIFCEHAYFDERYATNMLMPIELDYQATYDFIDRQTQVVAEVAKDEDESA